MSKWEESELSTKLIGIREEVQGYHRRKLEQLSLSHISDIPQLDEPTYEQKRWVLNRLKESRETWKRWYE